MKKSQNSTFLAFAKILSIAFFSLSLKITISKYLTKPEIFKWGRMASFQEKSLKRSSFQSLFSVLGQYISLYTRQ